LTPERVFSEFRKAFAGDSPSVFIQVLRDCGALELLLPEVNALFGIPQPEQYHPEIDTGIHTLLAIDRCAFLTSTQAIEGQQTEDQKKAMLVFVVLLHDLGKALSPKQHLPKHYGHEAKGVPLVRAVCQRLRAPKAWQQLAELVCHWHLHCHRVQEMRPQKVLELLEHLDVFRQPARLPAFLLACQADSQGRTGLEENPYPQAEYLTEAYRRVAAVSTDGLSDLGDGKKIAAELSHRRIQALTDIRKFIPSN